MRRPRPGTWVLLGLLVLLANLGQVWPLTSAIFEIDLARDVTEGFAVLDGQEPPLRGPEIGGRFHLAPWWFYVAAAVLAVAPSLSAYTLLLGVLASLKFALAAWVGVLLGGARLGAALVAAVALPGVTAYQFFGVTHTNFVEGFLWLSLAALLKLPGRRWAAGVDRQNGSAGRLHAGLWAGLSALAFCLAIHAHPTALAALPLWLALYLVCADGVRRAVTLLPWAVVGGVLPLLPASLEIGSAVMQLVDPTVQRPYAREVGDDLLSAFALLRGVLWTEPATLAGTAFAAGEPPRAWWRGIWILLTGSGWAGALWAAVAAPAGLRAIARWSVVGVLVAAFLVAQLVRVTPFYAAYVISVPLALVVAVGWVYLFSRGRMGHVLILGLTVAALALQWLTARAHASALQGGWVTLRVPEAGGVKSRERAAREVLYVTVTDRDRFAQGFCGTSGDRGPINGPFATALDASQGHELRLAGGEACRAALRFGPATPDGGAVAKLPMPRKLARRLGLAAPGVDGADGSGPWARSWLLIEPSRVISPAQPVLLSDERIYPPRLKDWERGRDSVLAFDLRLSFEDVLLVSPISSLHLGWSAELTVDGQRQPAEVDNPVLRAWRCRGCSQTSAVRLTVRGLAPELVNVVTAHGMASAQPLGQ